MISHDISILNGNVRGLNCPNKRAIVNETIIVSTWHIACIQESKLKFVDVMTNAFLGGYRLEGFANALLLARVGGSLCFGMRIMSE